MKGKGKSSKPGKKRKRMFNLALHKRRKRLTARLSKELKVSYGCRNFPIRKGDRVKVMIGKHKGKEGKVAQVSLKRGTIGIEKISRQIKDKERFIMLEPSNLVITNLVLEDEKRKKALERKGGKKIVVEKKEVKIEEAPKEEKVEEKKGE